MSDITQRVLFRVYAKASAVDVLECGHILPTRESIRADESHIRRPCTKCAEESAPEMPSVTSASRAARERVLWEWWGSAKRGNPLPPDEIKRILRAS